jgi:hypothetical protein
MADRLQSGHTKPKGVNVSQLLLLSGLRSDLTGFLRPFYATPPNRCDSNRPIVPLCAYSNLAVGAFAYHGGFHCRSPPVNRFDSLKND